MSINTYEANVTLVDGRVVQAIVIAESRQDAQYEFGHSPDVNIDGKQHRVAKVDYRSIKEVDGVDGRD